MKLLRIIFIMAVGMLFINIGGNAQSQTAQNDSTMNRIKIKNLKDRKVALQKQITIEDGKRNSVIEGVSPETLERLNEKQDSICLELRSELKDIELELKELEISYTATQIAQQYNSILHNNQQDSTQVVMPSQPAPPMEPQRPGKPTTPAKKKNIINN